MFLKRLLIILAIAALGLLAYSVFVENIFAPRLSPKDFAAIELNDLEIEVKYNRPSKRDREIFGALVPYNKVWRTGANEATTFSSNKDLTVKGMLLPKGDYTLWTVPMDSSWKVMFNSQQYEWGVNEKMEPLWNPNYDIIELEVPIEKIRASVEQFTIAFDNTTGDLKLTMAWDQTKIEVPMALSKPRNP
jgi:hypothetical protein